METYSCRNRFQPLPIPIEKFWSALKFDCSGNMFIVASANVRWTRLFIYNYFNRSDFRFRFMSFFILHFLQPLYPSGAIGPLTGT